MRISSTRLNLVFTLTLAMGWAVSLSADEPSDTPVRSQQTLWQTRTRDGFRYFSGNASVLGNHPAIYAHGGGITVVGRGFIEEFPMSRFHDAVLRYQFLLEERGYHPFDAAPIPLKRHPILGSWRVLVEGTECVETLTFEATGRTHSSGGEEITASSFEISAEPDAKGYYRMIDTIRETNGKVDCRGNTIPVGDAAMVFIRFTNKNSFSMCQREDEGPCRAVATRERKAAR